MPPIIALAPEADSIANQLERYTVVFAPFFIGKICGTTSEVGFTVKKIELGVVVIDLGGDLISGKL